MMSGKSIFLLMTSVATNYQSSYLTKNLLLPMVLPGPNEPKARPLQEFIIILVNDLLRLWEYGMRISATGEYFLHVMVAKWR